MTLTRNDTTAAGIPRPMTDSADTFAAAQSAVSRRVKRRGGDYRWLVMTAYIVFLMLPIYWLVNMSFKTNEEITGALTLYPHAPTLHNYTVMTSVDAERGRVEA